MLIHLPTALYRPRQAKTRSELQVARGIGDVHDVRDAIVPPAPILTGDVDPLLGYGDAPLAVADILLPTDPDLVDGHKLIGTTHVEGCDVRVGHPVDALPAGSVLVRDQIQYIAYLPRVGDCAGEIVCAEQLGQVSVAHIYGLNATRNPGFGAPR